MRLTVKSITIYNTCWAFQYANASLLSYLIWVNDWNMIVCSLKFKFKTIHILILPFSCFWNFAMTQINLAQTCRKFFVLINFWQWNTTGRPNDVYTHRSRLDLRNHRIPSGNKTIYRQFGTKILFNRLITMYDGYYTTTSTWKVYSNLKCLNDGDRTNFVELYGVTQRCTI